MLMLTLLLLHCSWGLAWGLDGSFRVAYGAAYTMQTDYTFALQVKEDVAQVQRRLRLTLAYTNTSNCLHHIPRRPERLVKLAEDLTKLTV